MESIARAINSKIGNNAIDFHNELDPMPKRACEGYFNWWKANTNSNFPFSMRIWVTWNAMQKFTTALTHKAQRADRPAHTRSTRFHEKVRYRNYFTTKITTSEGHSSMFSSIPQVNAR
jgi:hypothetical protein